MGTSAVELEKLVVRLVGDHSEYDKMVRDVVNQATAAGDAIEKSAGEIEAAQRRVMQEGMRVTQQLATAQERHVTVVRKLDELFLKGAISQETYIRGLNESRKLLPSVVEAEERRAKAQAELAAATARGKEVTNQMLTAEEKHIQKLQELDGLLRRGLISQETYNRAERQSLEQLPAMANAQQAYNQRIAEAQRVTQSVMTAEEQYRATRQRLNQQLALGDISQRTYNRAMAEARNQLPAYTQMVQAHYAAEARGRAIIDGLQTPLERYRARLDEINRLHREGYISAQDHARSVKRLGDEMEMTFGGRMIAWGRNATMFGRSMSMYVTAPIVALAGMGGRTFAGFEDGLLGLQAAANPTKREMEAVRQSALQLSKDLKVDPTKVVEGYSELIKAGMTVQNALSGAGKTAAQFARVGQIEVGKAAITISDSMNLFGTSSSDAANIFSSAADVSSISIQQMVDSFAQVSAVASQSNQGLRDTAAAVALLGNNGLKGSDAGTSLRTMLLRLRAPTDDAKAVLKQLGLDARTSTGQIKPMAELIDELVNKLGGLDTVSRDNAMMKIFGTDSIRAATIFIKEGKQGFVDLRSEMTNSLTVAQKYEKLVSGLTGQWDALTAAVRRFLIALGAEAKSVEGGFLDWVTKAIDNVTQWVTLNPQLTQTIIAVAAALATIGPAIVIIGTLTANIGRCWTAATKLSSAAQMMWAMVSAPNLANMAISALAALMRITGTTTIAMGALKFAAVGLALAGIALLVRWVYNANGAIKDFNKELERSNKLAEKLQGIDSKKYTDMLKDAAGISDNNQRKSFLEKALDATKADAAGMDGVVKDIEKKIKDFNDSHNTLGDKALLGQRDAKILEGLENDLAQAQRRAENTKRFVDEIEEQLGDAGRAVKNARNQAGPVVNEQLGLNGGGEETLDKKAARELAKTIEEFTPPIDKYNARLKELQEWRAKDKISAEVHARAVADAQKDLDKANADDNKASKAAKLTAELKNQIDTFGQVDAVRRALNLTVRDGTAAEIAAAQAAAQTLDKMDKDKKAQAEIERIRKKHRTPQQEFDDAKKELDMLLKQGLAIEDYNKELADLQRKLNKETKLNFSVSGIEAMEGGSAAAKARAQAQRVFLSQRPDFFKNQGFDVTGAPAKLPDKPQGKAPADAQKNKQEEMKKKELLILEKIAKNTDPVNRGRGRGGRTRTANFSNN